MTDLDVCQGAEVAFAADEDELARMVGARKKELAFSLGGMGSASTNFYNDAYSRQGWAEVAAEVRRLWLAGRRDDATALVTDDMVLATTLLGTEERCARAACACGATPASPRCGCTRRGRRSTIALTTLGRAMDIVRSL